MFLAGRDGDGVPVAGALHLDAVVAAAGVGMHPVVADGVGAAEQGGDVRTGNVHDGASCRGWGDGFRVIRIPFISPTIRNFTAPAGSTSGTRFSPARFARIEWASQPIQSESV